MGFARNESHHSMFSRRHYIAVAKRLNGVYRQYRGLEMDWACEPLDEITRQLTDLFLGDNPNFKTEKFLDAIWEGIKNET